MNNFDKLYQNGNLYVKAYDIKKNIGVDLRNACKVCGVTPYVKDGDNAMYVDVDSLSKIAGYYLTKSGQKKAVGRKLLGLVNELREEAHGQDVAEVADEVFREVGSDSLPPSQNVAKSSENNAFCTNVGTFDKSNVVLFNNEEFGDLMTITVNGAVWFKAKDVASMLGYKNTNVAVIDHVDALDKIVYRLQTEYGEKDTVFINESGLYRMIFSSKLQKAEQFTRWVTYEVLPSIRRHGAYMSNEVIEKTLTDPDFIIKLANQLKEERTKRIELEATIKEHAPKVQFADTVQDNCGGISIGEFAKVLNDKHGINIGRNRLFQWMKDNGYITYQDRLPYQRFLNCGWFTVSERVSDSTGIVYRQTNITGAGQLALLGHIIHDFKR